MSSGLRRATKGLTAVAAASVLATVAIGVRNSRDASATDNASQEGTQSFPRPLAPAENNPSVSPTETARAAPLSPATRLPGTRLTLPETAYKAYLAAEAAVGRRQPGCSLKWQIIAAIAQVESAQASGGALNDAGTAVPPIFGPDLDGGAFAAVPDTDQGRLDGSTRWDRAVGPLQFVPATWKVWGTDGSGDGVADPQNIFDASLSAGLYLCAGGRDLSRSEQLRAGILSYNRSDTYLAAVLDWIGAYSGTPEPTDPTIGTSAPEDQSSSSAPPNEPAPSGTLKDSPEPSTTLPSPSGTSGNDPSVRRSPSSTA